MTVFRLLVKLEGAAAPCMANQQMIVSTQKSINCLALSLSLLN